MMNPSELLFIYDVNIQFHKVTDLIDFLWDYDDDLEHIHWKDKDYWTLYKQCSQIIQIIFKIRNIESWQQSLQQIFILSNWVLLYSDCSSFQIQNYQSQQQWIHIIHWEIQRYQILNDVILELKEMIHLIKNEG